MSLAPGVSRIVVDPIINLPLSSGECVPSGPKQEPASVVAVHWRDDLISDNDAQRWATLSNSVCPFRSVSSPFSRATSIGGLRPLRLPSFYIRLHQRLTASLGMITTADGFASLFSHFRRPLAPARNC